jgi:hypothetical protein
MSTGRLKALCDLLIAPAAAAYDPYAVPYAVDASDSYVAPVDADDDDDEAMHDEAMHDEGGCGSKAEGRKQKHKGQAIDANQNSAPGSGSAWLPPGVNGRIVLLQHVLPLMSCNRGLQRLVAEFKLALAEIERHEHG